MSADRPGYRRERRGERFCYLDTKGAEITDAAVIRRIDALAIPPAYENVWICPRANGHLQATGLDARGRRQYRYHPLWRQLRDEDKFVRIEAFGRALPRIRHRVDRDLQRAARSRRAPDRASLLAAIVHLLDTTYVRVGNEEYAQANGSYGLTTLRASHAGVRGSRLQLKFRGKSGVMQEAELDDARVARLVRRCQQLPGQELFHYVDDDGATHTVDSADVNAYLREAAAPRSRKSPRSAAATDDAAAAADPIGAPVFSAKDFRTWHGTVQALELTRLACAQPQADPKRYSAKQILAEVARQLGNTPAVCKKSYVHPAVMALGSQLAGAAETRMGDIWERIAGTRQPQRRLRAAEARLLEFLRHHRTTLAKNAARGSRKIGRAAARAARRSAGKSRTTGS